jgi:hypothetical protein
MMMRTIYLPIFKAFLTVMLVAFFASCAEEMAYETTPDNDNPAPGGEMPEGAFLSIAGSSPGSSTFDQGVETRAYLDPTTYVYEWHPGEEIRMTILSTGQTAATSAIASNLLMTGTNTTRVTQTNFVGTLTQTLFDDLTEAGGSFDYYSYFQNGQTFTGMTFPNVPFTIPQSLSLEPNVFNRYYVPMVADPVIGGEPIIYIGTAEEPNGTLIDFDFKHILSYAAIEMDVALTSAEVTSITLTNNNGTMLWGTYGYNLLTKTGGYTSGGSSLTIPFSPGAYFTPGPNKVLFVPMPPVDMTGQTFTLSFATTGSTNTYESITVPGINFQRGVIHKLRVAPRVFYTTNETFTVTQTGYYYAQVWGGNGGNAAVSDAGNPSGNGGSGGNVSGLFYFQAGTTLNIQVGTAGASGPGLNSGSANGGVGTWFGNGGQGGMGDRGNATLNTRGADGGAGGAASGILVDGTATSNIIIAAGGGGGGGGLPGGITITSALNGGAGSFTDNSSGSNSTNNTNGAAASGDDGSYGGGGGGGGYQYGGYGGPNGNGVMTSNASRGGAGAGGMNYLGTQATNPGFTLPTNTRPAGRTDGYVVITFFRP